MEAVDGKIVITRKDGSQVVVTYSESKTPADVSEPAAAAAAQQQPAWLPSRLHGSACMGNQMRSPSAGCQLLHARRHCC